MCGYPGDNPLPRCRPVLAIVKKGAHLLDDLADVRLPRDIVLRQSPDLQISRVVQLESPVAAVHRDPLEQIVEGRAAHLGQGIARTLERQLVGYVLVDKCQAAERMR